MADSKESFEILENGSGDGVAATASQIGEASGGKVGMTVFPFRDSSGNLRMPEVNASNVLKTDGSAVTQPVSDNGGSLTVDGTVAISGSVAVTGPLTDTQLRATPVPISGTVTANAGTNLNTSALALETTQSTQNTRIGDLIETAPASDTASSGLNGRLQRVAQRITSLISALSDGTAKFQISNGTNEVAVLNSAPSTSSYGLVVRQVPFELATFSAIAEATVVGNNKSMIAIQNTGTSKVTIREVWIINDRTTAITGIAGDFRLMRITSFTGGTAITPVQFDSSDSLPSDISIATGSTVSGETATIRLGKWSTDEWGPGTLDQEGLDHAIQQIYPFWTQTPGGKGIVLRQNQGAHVKFATNSTSGSFNIRIVFTTE